MSTTKYLSLEKRFDREVTWKAIVDDKLGINEMNPETVEDVISALGGRNGIMAALDCRRQHVAHWRRSGKFPAHLRPKIERALAALLSGTRLGSLPDKLFTTRKEYKKDASAD